MKKDPRRTVALIFGLGLTGLSAYCLADGWATAKRHSMTVTEIEAGSPLPGRWLELTGRLRPDDRLIWSGPDGRETFVPLVGDMWKPGDPIAVFVRAREVHWGEPGRLLNHPAPTVAGLVDRHGLPDDVRTFFAETERPPAENALVLDFDANPGEQLLLSGIALGLGLAILFTIEFVWLFQRKITATPPIADGKDNLP